MNVSKEKDSKEKFPIETGYFEDGLPYAKIGDKSKILVNIEALSTEHKPPSGFVLNQFKKDAEPFLDDYTVYRIGRKPNLPEGFFMDKMAKDYATLIRREFNGPVDIMGISTGGQIAHFLAADHPDTVHKLVIISAAFRISEKGEEIERKAAVYFQQKKYGKSMAATMEMVYPSGIKRALLQSFIRLMGKLFFRNLKYPNDFLIEVQADREMNFKERLSEISAPTLIMSGVDDVAYNVDDVRTTAEGIPNADLKLFDGYGHNLAVSNRKEVLEEALRFLKK